MPKFYLLVIDLIRFLPVRHACIRHGRCTMIDLYNYFFDYSFTIILYLLVFVFVIACCFRIIRDASDD